MSETPVKRFDVAMIIPLSSSLPSFQIRNGQTVFIRHPFTFPPEEVDISERKQEDWRVKWLQGSEKV